MFNYFDKEVHFTDYLIINEIVEEINIIYNNKSDTFKIIKNDKKAKIMSEVYKLGFDRSLIYD